MQPESIYHITHVENLPGIVAAGHLACDSEVQTGVVRPARTIGMSRIKQQRLIKPVPCVPSLRVGDCVPFFYGPRSVMLYSIYVRQPGLDYSGGQDEVVHLVSDLRVAIAWCKANGVRWIVADGNAAAALTGFYSDSSGFDHLDIAAINATWWSDSPTKERKQAEFLVPGHFPWRLVSKLGVFDASLKLRVEEVVGVGPGAPPVVVERGWYY